MKQEELERAVARQTGESMSCIRQMGFQLIEVKHSRPYRRRMHTAGPDGIRNGSMLPANELIEQVA